MQSFIDSTLNYIRNKLATNAVYEAEVLHGDSKAYPLLERAQLLHPTDLGKSLPEHCCHLLFKLLLQKYLQSHTNLEWGSATPFKVKNESLQIWVVLVGLSQRWYQRLIILLGQNNRRDQNLEQGREENHSGASVKEEKRILSLERKGH